MSIDIATILGEEADELLAYQARGIPATALHLPGPDFVNRALTQSDRSPAVLRNIQTIFDHGRLAGTGYVSILPVDQGVEHSAGASFAPNPAYFDPGAVAELAIAGGCNALASAVINKRAGGAGLISGRKAFQRPIDEGVQLLHAIQDVYLDTAVTVA